jgi:7-cyano-7-deazaguanine synthase
MKRQKAIVIHSGGLDSTVLLYEMRRDFECISLGFDYGQRHAKELEFALELCDKIAIRREFVDLEDLRHLLGGSSQTDRDVPVPEGHYAEENMKLTVVPNRNMIMLSIAAGVAIAQGAEIVAFGAHAGDHAIYPDCRRVFVDALGLALDSGNYQHIRLFAPFLDVSKADIVRRGAELEVPFELTWSCYKGKDVHCGKCGTCVERLEAFDIAGVVDPVEYADREFYKQVTRVQ